MLSLCGTLHCFCEVLVCIIANSQHDVSRHALAGIGTSQAHNSEIAQQLILGQMLPIVPFRQFVRCVKIKNHAAWSQEAPEALKCAQALDA